MLSSLHVKNFALIRECEVEFERGLNILTGETGAGKSILLGSLQLALGGKMSREMLRRDADYGLVEMTFSIENEQVRKNLEALDIFPEDGAIVLSRKLLGNRSICRINGETCTMALMKQAASYLLDIHGQHEHQSLLYKNKQLDILDAFGKEELAAQKENVKQLYDTYTAIKKELSAQTMDAEQRKREMAFLEFEIQEIESALLTPKEDEALERQYRIMNNSRKIVEYLQKAYRLTGYEQQAAGDLVGQALHQVSGVSEYDTEIENLESLLGDIDGLLNDFNRELSAYLNGLTFEEEEFIQIEQRLDLINSLKAKYGSTIEAILEYGQKQKQQLEAYRSYEETKARLQKELQESERRLKDACDKLTALRKMYGKELETLIIAELQELNFLDARFRIHFEKLEKYTANGTDDVEFLIAANPGEPQMPLGKVVSGGELSRIMLAIKTILADKDEVDTLIFDEIDTGISGRTAQMVSEKLARIGNVRQVLCITHLPQIASMADVHYVITKEIEKEQTVTKIEKLNQEKSVEELARLLGGTEITDMVRNNAREMKLLAQQQKNTRLHS